MQNTPKGSGNLSGCKRSQLENLCFLNALICFGDVRTLFAKVNLIWRSTSNKEADNYCKWIVSLCWFRQPLDFFCNLHAFDSFLVKTIFPFGAIWTLFRSIFVKTPHGVGPAWVGCKCHQISKNDKKLQVGTPTLDPYFPFKAPRRAPEDP